MENSRGNRILVLSSYINPGFQYRSENYLDFEILLQQQQRHKAYTSKLLEQKFKLVSTRPDTLTTIQPNKASHFVHRSKLVK
ncbi:hypothetical protein RhiirA5_437332 [Rhizophagus irregularis]|uniref:Uncharacterized protein n=1 Tax=Rhizophagus irregularis TaxID=588596 RepID=A0A2N0NKN3_9GLOM|nr:hypothetical protein RhiirA5_437332 [Rhizophagus irregularis]